MGKIKLIVNTFGSALALLAIASVVVYAQSVWTPPTSAPPGDNTPAPVNVGASNQVKIGGLGVGPLAVFGNAFVTGDLDVSSIYKSAGRPGVTAACPAGQTLTALETRGGIVVGGSCGAAGGGGGGSGFQGQFGGMYSYTWNGPNCTGSVYGSSPNSVTGGYSCPAGYSAGSTCYYGANNVPSMTTYYCYR